VPALVVIYLSPTPLPALLMPAAAWFLGNTWLGPVQATLQGLAGLRMRAMALAVLLFVNNLIGLGLGPQVVGIMSDLLRPQLGEDSLALRGEPGLIAPVLRRDAHSPRRFARGARSTNTVSV
jgi:hypothetical protein